MKKVKIKKKNKFCATVPQIELNSLNEILLFDCVLVFVH